MEAVLDFCSKKCFVYSFGEKTNTRLLYPWCLVDNSGTSGYISGPVCDQVDIVFLVDSSGSIQRNNWQIILDFMKNIVRDFTIGPNNVRIGVAIFGNDVQPMFQLNTYSSQFEILNAIDRIPFLDQTTNTPAAIRYMRTAMFTPQNGDRPSAPNSVIIITDGVPRVPTDVNEARRLTLQEANLARSQGINIFTIGIGPELTRDFLVQIANQPSNQYVFQVNQVRELESILNQVSSAACTPTPPPTGAPLFQVSIAVFPKSPFVVNILQTIFVLFQFPTVIKKILFSWLTLLEVYKETTGKLCWTLSRT